MTHDPTKLDDSFRAWLSGVRVLFDRLKQLCGDNSQEAEALIRKHLNPEISPEDTNWAIGVAMRKQEVFQDKAQEMVTRYAEADDTPFLDALQKALDDAKALKNT